MNRDGSTKELYDVAASSLEVDNLADRNLEIVKRMARQLQVLFGRTAQNR